MLFAKRFLFSFLIAISLWCGALGVAAMPLQARAQTTDGGLGAIGSNINLPNTDPRVIAVRVINIALGTLGIIFVILIVYAGFLYLTSGGDPEKTRRAIAMIRNGIIGLIIILLSWALARYILTKLMEATGAGNGGNTNGGNNGPPGGGFGPGGSSQFSIRAITPNGSVVTRKVIVKILFSKPVDAASASAPGMITVTRLSDNAVIAGTVTSTGGAVRFTPNTPCPPPNTDRFCFDENTDYRVTVSPQLKSQDGITLTCGGFAAECTQTFRSGTEVDITPPEVNITEPINGFGVPTDSIVNVRAFVRDNTGIGYVAFTDNGTLIGQDAPTGQTPTLYSARVQWDTAGLSVGTTRTLQASAYDVDSGASQSTSVSVVLRSPHCFNGVQDQGETGLDCGGPSSSSADYCGACTSGQCSTNTDCASGVCQNGVCVERPIITSIEPADGAPGTYVTVHGANFGSNGTVQFLGSGTSTAVKALPPSACSNQGITTWSPTQVVVEVPKGAQSGPLRLTNAVSGLFDDTNAVPDPMIPDYVVNDVSRPGICAVVPPEGQPGTRFIIYGTQFGTTSAGILFGSQTLVASSWLTEQIQSSIPNIAVGTYDVAVDVGGMVSNAVSMRVKGAETGGNPMIASIDPAQGPVGTMVTLSGSNFGTTLGTVYFERTDTGEVALADTNLTAACSAAAWTDQSIVVKVPKQFTQVGTGNLAPGSYAVYVKTARPTAPNSNKVNFLVNTDPLAPGICSIIPRIGPVGTKVAIYGEGFTSGPGTARYYQNVTDPSAVWSSERVSSTIPVGAQSGAVTVQPANGRVSNPYTIQVRNCNEASGICGGNEICCEDGACVPQGTACAQKPTRAMYGWQFSTGVIPRAPTVVEQCTPGALPSPSPWSSRSGGTEACLNVRPVILFSTTIEPSSVTLQSGNIGLYRCTGSESDPCSTTNASPESLQDIRLVADTENRDALILTPSTLSVSSWYEIKLTTGVRGIAPNGLPMVENAAKCGAGFSYCFTFKTRADASPCEIGAVEVSPDPYTAFNLERPIGYRAIPTAKGDACQTIACEPYAWTWGVSDARASVTHTPNSDPVVGGEACEQRVTPIAETGDSNPVQITAQAAGTTGAGQLYIKLVPPKVTSHGPDCDKACVNAAVWAAFNVPMDPTSMTASNIRIERCQNESCKELMNPPTIALTDSMLQLTAIPNTSGTDGRFLVISPQSSGASLLTPGAYYRVILLAREGSGIRSSTRMPLTGLNYPEGYAWMFRVKQGDDAFCKPEHVSVTPAEKYETLVGSRQGFFAAPYTPSDACSDQGQLLMSLNGYSWSVDDQNVAILLNNGRIDTGSVRSVGCNGRCTQVGSQGEFGKIARCGDGVVQTVDAKYCERGRTRSGANCTVLPPGSSGSEECDETSANCNSRCLWEPVNPVSQTGGTCGDGNVQANEDCDYGSICMGASTSSGIADGTDCTRNRTACISAGGKCEPHETRGCSVFCRHLGSRSAGSTCGNGDVADGEDCDDGNLTNGDGCSANCLYEGSSKEIVSLCGNTRIEPGEQCEKQTNGAWPAGCDPKTCLNTGTQPCKNPGDRACCGNGSTESGEDCDDGNAKPGDGCSPICKYEGSSEYYPAASFCGDGTRGTGEDPACEVAPAGPDGLIDAYQIAEIIGKGTLAVQGSLMSTKIHATYQAVTGDATYGLRCGNTREDQCSLNGTIDAANGLSDAGCCSARPTLVSSYPVNGERNVCRNALVYGDFNTAMDTNSLSASFAIGEEVQGSSCPSGQTQISIERLSKPGGWKGMLVRAWNAIRMFFGGRDAYAQVICSGGITGRLSFATVRAEDGHSFTRFFYTLDHVLKANATTTVVFRGDASLVDNGSKEKKEGIRTIDGVVSNRDWRWAFVPGTEICTVNEVDLEDGDAQHPGLFLQANEAHPFTATARSWHGNRMMPISSTEEYQWQWQNWTISNQQLAKLDPTALPASVASLSVTTSTVASQLVSGSGYVSARVVISKDASNNPSTVGQVVQGTLPITVTICENPWPSRAEAPFRDEEHSPSLAGTPFALGPDFYNFSMLYCRDAADPGPLGDLPSLAINAVPTNAVDASQGILRQYLFTFAEPELKKDAIGIRIASNPLHLSPEEWYISKGFTGKPQALTIDGYQAIRDGRTVYVSAVNTDGPQTKLYSNIYIISYNDGAEAVTRQIYDALLSSLTFNRNVQRDIAGVCQDAAGSEASGGNGAPVSCVSDIDCNSYGDQYVCANFKAKLQRDLIRLADFGKMTRILDEAKVKSGSYPNLQTGSYIGGMSTSLWPSWTDTLGKAIGTFPKDPLNRFVTCGRCANSRTACTTDADCPSGAGACTSEAGFDPQTCWNTQSLQFACAVQNSSTSIPTSRIYMYQALDNGKRYQLSSEFEVPPPNSLDVSQNWWWPPLPTEVKQCASGGLKGSFCATDADCRVCPNNNCTNVPTVAGSCQLAGGSYVYTNICKGQTVGQSTTCGDGVVSADAASPELCETQGPTSSQYRSCTTADGSSGYQKQICNACREYIDDPQSSCIPASVCGNGKRDGFCTNSNRPCGSDAECGSGGVCSRWETCDDGKDNGTYGHCKQDCSGYGASCGDGMISAGEVCDLAGGNAEWVSNQSDASASCNLTCSAHAAFCGDGVITKPFEECDGNTEKTTKSLCSVSHTVCDSSSDCPSGETCGGAADLASCPSVRVCSGASAASGLNGRACESSLAGSLSAQECAAAGGTCSTQAFQTIRTRTCDASSCRFPNDWSSCQFEQKCGNGIKEGAEACDDGNQDDTDGCTTSCTVNVCGDGHQYKGVEECDMGAQNGKGCSVSAEYGSTCTSCSTSCKLQLTQGGFCGDGIKNASSAEQCDGDATVPNYDQLSCASLGYDYLKPGLSKIQCSQSCSFTGCAYCGDPPPLGTTDPLYQGMVEGIAFDTVSQQPVPNARVTLFYRGLQVSVTSSDQKGYFKFTDLDRHTGCSQYRIVIDSYADNPLTETLDESKRGGYGTVQTPPFSAYAVGGDADEQTYLNTMTGAKIAISATHPTESYSIPQFSMIPRLKANEYIVQFWWDPTNGVQQTISDFQRSLASDPTGNAYYAGHMGDLHDLVVRLPFTYVPGTFSSCTLSSNQPVKYDGTNGGRNPTVTSANVDTYVPGVAGPDKQDAVIGMANCTNKIRATAQKTCSGGTSLPASLNNKLGCTMNVNWECTSNLIGKYNFPGSTCRGASEGGAPEPSRSGSPKVLQGSEGAYLFCTHPEWGDDPQYASQRKTSSCTNFIVPPQSVFIHANSGQYDILVSAYQQFQNKSNDLPSIREWLIAHNGRIRLYDQYGFNKEWGLSDADSLNPGWNTYDDYTGDICFDPSLRVKNNNPLMNSRMFAYYTNDISTVWTPISIDAASQRVIAWNNGNTGADYRYFADLYTHEWAYRPNPGDGSCWERTCSIASVDGMSGTYFPPRGSEICSDGMVGYSGEFNSDPACDTASQSVCPAGSYCKSNVNPNVRCIKKCTSDAQGRSSDCSKSEKAFCGGSGLNGGASCGGPGVGSGR